MADGAAQVDEEKKTRIGRLSGEDLRLLTDDQVRMVEAIALERVNSKALERVRGVLEGEEDTILRSLTEPPFIYTSNEIEIFPSLKVKFSSTLSSQEIDAKEAVNEVYNRDETIDLTSARVNLIYLVHGLTYINGDPCGGVGLSPDKAADPDHLKNIRESRIEWLRAQPAHIIDRLTEFSRAFQAQISSLTRDEKLLIKVGN